MRKRYDFLNVRDVNNETQEAEERKKKNSIHSVSVFLAIGVLVFLFGLYGVAYALYGLLPTPLKLENEVDYPDSFIAEKAQSYLKLLTDLGPRVVGSYENEFLSVDILKREIELIQQQANKNHTIEVDIQVVTGSYLLGYKPNSIINAYSNVQNVVVKLSSRNDSESSVLVNAHFDSVPTSPGGSDDGINCAAMLEVLRKLSRLSSPFQNDVIFLFNGAEESPLQAAHGFITQHKWAPKAKVVVNLEAAGAGGKIVLFQTGPNMPWLMKYYGRVPHPQGTATGEEMFQSGVIPSDTDFRVFRDFGGLVGFDMAFINSGYRYHTKFDGFSNIPLGSFQHVGDNTLSLVKDLSNAPELNNILDEPKGTVVFFDVFGLFMISYSNTVAIILNVLVALTSILVFAKAFVDLQLGFSKQTFKYFGVTLASVVGGWLLAVIFVVVVAFVIDALKFSMSWYGSPWIAFGLYAVPAVGALVCPSIVLRGYFGQKWCISIQAQIQAHVVRLIWTTVLIIGTILGVRSVFFVMIPVAFHSLMFLVIHLFKKQHSVTFWKVVYLVGLTLPVLLLMYYTIILFSFIIPICGRIGSERNPELIIGALTVFFTIFITSYFVPLITLVRQPFVFVLSCFTIFIIAFIIVFTPLGFPYSGNESSPTPQRFYVFHTNRIFHNETDDIVKNDSGFFFINVDRNSPESVRSYVTELQRAKSISNDCDVAVFCGLPMMSVRIVPVLRESTWIPAGKPIITLPIKLTVNSKENITSTIIRYNITASGPDHQGIYLSPKSNASLLNTSLADGPSEPSVEWNGRPVYIIIHTYGKEKAELNFSFDVEVPDDWKQSYTVDIAMFGSYVHKRIQKTPQYLDLLKKFPDWADVVPFVGAYESWVI